MMVLSLQENDIETAQLHLNGDSVSRLNALNPAVIDITSRFAPERKKVESFIRDIYRASYNADITVTYPMLMSVRDAKGKILAAAGFRSANQETLFLEQYTQAPIEDVLSERYGESIARNEIVEIGNLASAGQGASLFLFAALSSFLDSRLIRYVTITGTDALQTRLRKLGLSPQVLCDADPARLKDKHTQNWGHYYDTQPRVLSGSIKDGVRRLERVLGVVYQDCRPALTPRLHYRIPS